ncbi:phage exclusion protein Lit family protein [Longimicrobium sp.]|uniref:phage exclusion protein Lit family protein n=1 Tax=Longimicrobium sp. TaxID=2029185 RepID=UPI002E37035E|nr:phage exclusion protein Lit family protein [Longimicrobium sp.]HEX6036788.1 phage exclusion protein Lit family protein [Longimicrobium sp.]
MQNTKDIGHVETPVRLLSDNVLERFQNAQAHTLARHLRNLAAGKLIPAIGWDDRRMPPKGPCADPESRQIVLQEVFLAYLWAVTYALLVIDQEAHRRSIVEGRFEGELDFTKPALAESWELFVWAMGLQREYSDWPEQLPAPDRPRVIEGIDYTGRANGIFMDAAAYLLFHEYAHLVDDHWSVMGPIRAKPDAEVSEEECEILKQIETEADVEAREALLASDDPDSLQLSRGVGIVIAHAASLLIVPRPSKLRQIQHPDVDSRLVNAIYALTPEEVGPRDMLWTVASLACSLFLRAHGLTISQEPAETAEDLLRRYMAEMDLIKSSRALS